MKHTPAKDRAPAGEPSFFMGLLTRPLGRYALAVVVAAAAFLLRYDFSALFGPRVAYITFYPAVMVAAVLGGFGPGLLATGLSGLFAAVWILAPVGQIKIENTADAIGLAMFLAMGVFMSAVAGLYRGARERAAAYDKSQAIREAEERFREVANARPTPATADRAPARYPEAMQAFQKRLAFDAGLTLTVAMLAAVGLLSYRNMTSATEADRWETHTYQVVDKLGDLLTALADTESGQRGFIITGTKSYHDQYEEALGRVDQQLNSLRRQTADNPRQQQRLDAIRRLLAERLALLKNILDLRASQGFEAASAAVMTGRGSQIMDDLRRLVNQARQEEEQLLKDRGAEKESSTATTIHLVVLGATLGGGVLVVVFILLKLEFARRQRIERELRVHQDHLTELVAVRTQELRREREALRVSEERLRVTLTSIGDAVIATDAEGRITFLNPVATALTGWQPEEAQGQPVQSVFRIIDERTRAPGADIVSRVLREKRVIALANHTSLLAKDDREWPIEDSAAPILDATGTLTGAVLVFHDVTQRRRAEEALRESADRLNFALETSHIGAWDLDLANHTAFRSLEHDRIFGYAAMLPEWTYEKFLEHILSEDRATVEGKFRHAMETKGDWNFECRIRRIDGAVRWIWAAGRHQPAAAGTTHRMAGIVQDITERKEAEEQLQELTRRLTYHVDNSPLAVIEWGPDMRLTRWSGEAERIFGWKAAEVLGKRMEDFRWIYAEDTALVGEVSTGLQTGANPRRFSTNRNYRKDGSIAHCEWYNSSLLDASGQLRSIMSLVLDVTARHQAEEETRRLHEIVARERDRLSALLNSIADEIWFADTAGNFTLANPSAVREFSVSAQGGIGVAKLAASLEVLRADGSPRPVTAAPPLRALAGEIIRGEDEIVRTPGTGELRHRQVSAAPVRDANGGIIGSISVVRDVTEHKRAEAALVRSEEQYRSLFSTLIEGFCIIEVLFDADNRPNDYRFLQINPAFAAQTGLQNAQGKRMRELAPEHEATWFEIYGRVAVTGEPARFGNEAKALNRWFDVSAYRIGGPDSRKVAILFNDITERRQAEMALQRAKDELEQRVADRTADLRAASLYARGLLEASLDPLVTISPEGRITDVNHATELATGRPREQLVGSSFSDYFTEPGQASAGYRQVLAQGEVRDYPLTLRHVSDRTIDVLYNAVVYHDEAGRVLGVFAAARDVTEQKRTAAELDLHRAHLEDLVRQRTAELESANTHLQAEIVERRRAEDQVRLQFTVLQSAANGLVITGRDGTIQWVNAAFTKLTGYTAAEAVGQNPRVLKSGQQDAAFFKAMWQTIVAGQVWHGELVNRRKDGQFYPEEMTITPVAGADGKITHFVAVKQDIAERRRAEEALQHAAAELARSNEELQQFAYVASHDLQEPLRAVAGYVNLIESRFSDKFDDKGRQHIAGAVQGAMRMHTLITDLLELSRVGTRVRAIEPTDLNAVLGQVTHNLSAAIGETGARIISDPLPTLQVDAGQMAQLFQNLIGNALKFHGAQPPEIHVSAQSTADGPWLLAVRDNGIGIDPRYFERIFLIFQRLHTRKEYPGTGIGLAICRKIVERHGGRIWVESQPGLGSTFYFTLPNQKTS